MLKFLFAITLSLLIAAGAVAEEQGPPEEPTQAPELELANRYINALTERNFRTLRRMLHRETKFKDEMAGKDVTGTRDILMFLKRVHTYTESYAFVIDHQFFKGSEVVMIGSYYYQARGDLFGMPGKLITLTIPGVTMLDVDVDEQRIDEHVDILDYATMKAQLKLYHYEPIDPVD
ncbi:ester cyclase [Ferrimonas lipolytica]|uniref:Nuclear transport factor 2 family protein n=1 Tax=Ferrimonas lipolytica TaxID=2724191 RepID=A0A6H1UJF2_9GAMM|nr:ester cyclase [Ferrimonas lipolytica]QIZ78740.1 nuclear transport factor 2 family protein [Ferrimonas lipolytica]